MDIPVYQLKGYVPPRIKSMLAPLVEDLKRTRSKKIHQIAIAVMRLFPRASAQQARILTLYAINEANIGLHITHQPPVPTPVMQADVRNTVFSDSLGPTINVATLTSVITEATTEVKTKLEAIQQAGDDISVGDMFSIQMIMNQLSQLTEMTSSVVSASNSAMMSMARNIKS